VFCFLFLLYILLLFVVNKDSHILLLSHFVHKVNTPIKDCLLISVDVDRTVHSLS